MTGAEIRAIRKARGLSQTALGAAIGMPGGQPYISAVERGEINVQRETLDKIAAALGYRIIVRWEPTQEALAVAS